MDSFSRSTVYDFIQSEKKLLNEAAFWIKKLLTKKTFSREASLETGKNFLENIDYVYLDFPDPPPLPRIEQSFLKRSLLSCHFYLDKLEKTSRLMESKD